MNSIARWPKSRGKRRHQRGIAVLAVSLALLTAMAMTAVFVNRSLLFGQRSTSNQYRSVRAFQAAEAGLQWATALLNDPRPIDSACRPTATGDSFRTRYLQPDALDHYVPTGSAHPACLIGQARLLCACAMPTASGTPPLTAVSPLAGAPTWGDDARFSLDVGVTGSDPQSVSITSHGCTRVDADCNAGSGGQVLEGVARVTAIFKLRTALPPALTASSPAPISQADGVMVLVPGSWHDF